MPPIAQQTDASPSSSSPSSSASSPANDSAVRGLVMFGRRLVAKGRLDLAERTFEKLALDQPDRSIGHTCLGAVAIKKDEPSRARQHLERALALDPNDVAALCHLGELLFRHDDDLRQAEAHLARAVSLDPDGANAFARRAGGLLPVVRHLIGEVAENGVAALHAARARLLQFQAADDSDDGEQAGIH